MESQRVIVTGGSGDIGCAMGARLFRDGFSVTLLDLKAPSEISDDAKALMALSKDGHECVYRQVDVTNRARVDEVLSEFEKDLVAVLANAGIVKSQPFLEISEAYWSQHLDANLTGVFHTLQSAAKIFVKNKRPGQIIITGSWVGTVPWPEIAAYSATKAAVEMLAKSAARELAEHKIRVNVIAPGIVNAGLARHQLNTEPQYAARVAKVIPLKELQTAEQVADIASFLCSKSGDYLTGSTILADGGASLFQFD
jgi:NAD(P)-dependent dehydrogenase (short-subunit alcohol dehydrogenase family)